jgi:electron transport complex protein RnfG
MKNSKIMPAVVLSAICLVVGLLLAFINSLTAPIIADAQNQAANAALIEVYPGGSDFKQLDLSGYTLPESITAAYSEGSGGYVIQSTVTGYKSGLVIMCGINKDGKIVGADYIASNETLSAEVGLGDRFVNKGEDEMTPDIVAGSTAKLTTGAYYNAILDAFKAFTVFNGGTVDIRTPEQILQDNCNAALGTEGKTFEKWFATEEIGVDALYITDDGAVALIYGTYVGINADGTVSTEGVNAETGEKEIIGDGHYAAAYSAYILYSESVLTEVAKPEGASRLVTKIYKTASGNYVFEATASGFSANYHGSDIILKVSISADGKIIDCLTVSHSESKGYGDACATEEYYDSWRGVSAENIVVSEAPITDATVDPGAIAGATYTSNGYQKAIRAAFKAFELLTTSEGGNQ